MPPGGLRFHLITLETQIGAGDLFDFDLEVGPILDVLVGKTLEVAMLELMEEEELSAIRSQQEKFEMMRAAELAEVQRLEYEAKRKFAEKQRRKKQEREFREAQDDLQEKVAAQAFGIGTDRVHVGSTDSDKVPNNPPPAASYGADLNGMAVLNACQKVCRSTIPRLY